MELTHRHQAPMPSASRVETVIKTIWKPLSVILTNDRIVPREIGEEKKTEDEENRKDQDAIDHPLLGGEMHKDGSDQARLEGRYQHRDRDVGLLGPEINVGEGDRDDREDDEGSAHHEVSANVLCHIVGGMLLVGSISGGRGG